MSFINDVRAVLKVVYKDKPVETLLGRLDPVYKNIAKPVYRGKLLNFLNIYGRSPAVSSNKVMASSIAAQQGTKNAEWSVPLDRAQIFGCTVVTQKQILASKDKVGAYQTIGQNLMYGSMSGLRRQAAALFYSRGFGEFAVAPTGGTLTVGPNNTIILPRSAIAGIDVGTRFQFANATTGLPAANASINIVTNIVQGIPGQPAGSATVTFSATAADAYTAGMFLVYLGNHNGTQAVIGELIAPNGLETLFPSDPVRRNTTLYGVDRSLYPARLSGAFIDDSALPAATNLKISTINKLVNEIRQAGGDAEDYQVVLSANDYMAIYAEIQSRERFLQTPGDKERSRIIKSGISDMEFSQASTWIGKVVDTPFLQDGKFYVLTPNTIQFVTYSNLGPLDNNYNNGDNAPGVGENPLAEADKSEEPTRVNIDDFFSLQPATHSPDGNAVEVTAAIFGELICTNSAVNGVGLFPAA